MGNFHHYKNNFLCMCLWYLFSFWKLFITGHIRYNYWKSWSIIKQIKSKILSDSGIFDFLRRCIKGKSLEKESFSVSHTAAQVRDCRLNKVCTYSPWSARLVQTRCSACLYNLTRRWSAVRASVCNTCNSLSYESLTYPLSILKRNCFLLFSYPTKSLTRK